MPQEINYESQLEQLRKHETELRQRLAQIADERTTKMNDAASLYGVSAADVDLGSDAERQRIQEELNQVIEQQRDVFNARKQAKIAEDKQRREDSQTEINRNGKLQQAYKFFTYLDTGTTKGYNLNGLTEEAVLGLYDDFMTKPEYAQLKSETLEKAMRDDREIIIPILKQEENTESTDIESQLRTREVEIRERLAQIADERTTNMNDAASLYGVSAADVDLGVSEERKQLQSELDKILDQKALLEGVKGINYANERKAMSSQKR